VERWVIFRTNQGTDAHLRTVETLKEVKHYHPVVVRGEVASDPKTIPGRHVIFPVKDKSAIVDCAAYEPTGALRHAARQLIIGDFIEICGGVRKSFRNRVPTINLEKIRVLKLAPKIAFQNPACPQCGKRLKSMGTNKGFRCEKCGSRYAHLRKVEIRINREIREGLYITSIRSQRHLTKPLRRYGMEKRDEEPVRLIEGWHFP
jgi:tRNA(Ile2)-agmatinylcytidine synthase